MAQRRAFPTLAGKATLALGAVTNRIGHIALQGLGGADLGPVIVRASAGVGPLAGLGSLTADANAA